MSIATHAHDLAYEAAFWGDCCNTYGEESKQFVYARCMELDRQNLSFDVHGARILDLGGGPASLLLKTLNLAEGYIVDPIVFPAWTEDRYASLRIKVCHCSGEDLQETGWDEVWLYNVLQHVVDPERVIANARRAGALLRVFEWIDMPAYEGHPHALSEAQLLGWLGVARGQTQTFNGESGCFGRAFYGVFPQ